MESPTVATEFVEPKTGGKYRILAYRTVSMDEAMFAISMYLRQTKSKRPKKGTVVTIVTLIGGVG